MSFGAPLFLLALVALPVAVALYLRSQSSRRRAATAFASPATMPSVAPASPGWRRHAPMIAYAAAVAAVAFALARPEATVAVPEERASVILAIDSSGSMDATDVEPSRLAAARQSVEEFLDDVPEELRVGAVAFNHRVRTVEAPTTDREEVRGLVSGLEPRGGTATGEALATSLRILERPGDKGKRPPAAIVLLSDGKSTHGREPLPLVREAASRRIPIYTVALGTPGGTIEIPSRNGAGVVREPVPPDPETLEEIASVSGGRSYAAEDRLELSEIYERLGSQIGERREKREISYAFAGGAALFLVGGGLMSLGWFARLP